MSVELTSEERSFFTLVQKAVASNPFSEERKKLDHMMTGHYGSDASKGDILPAAIREVNARIQRLEAQKRHKIRQYAGDDRNMVKSAILFEVFHKFIPSFDQLIIEQMEVPDRQLKVSFAHEALALLQKRGFSFKAARRYFELFFQMRRAFFFIQQSLVGQSGCMVKLRERLWNNVFTHNIDLYDQHLWNRMEDFSTLVLGPTGAGKGTAAAAIGRSGYIPFDTKNNCFLENFSSAFIPINLSQYSQALIESELFGHKKGAFTGAIENYPGVFSRCSPYGAILLDEIGEVSEPIQIKLLQVLQERSFLPVGDHKAKRFSGRVIAATNRTLSQLRKGRILRDDFFYRLCSDIIVVPGLAQRIAEDPGERKDLLAHTIQRIVGKPARELTNRLHRLLLEQVGEDYPWPGNVRELEQCVRRLLICRQYNPGYQAMDHEPLGYLKDGIAKGNIDAQSLIAGYCYMLYKRHGTYEAVAQRTRLDRRTAKKHIEAGMAQFQSQLKKEDSDCNG